MEKINYIIRNLNDKDLADVAELYTLFWNDSMDVSKMKQKFSGVSKNPNYIFLCAEENGRVIGTIQGIVCEELYGECLPFLVMENFVVAEKFRGKGVGRQLLKELEKIGKERKCSQIIFITETDRKDTIEFYEKVGFNSTSHRGFKKSLK